MWGLPLFVLKCNRRIAAAVRWEQATVMCGARGKENNIQLNPDRWTCAKLEFN